MPCPPNLKKYVKLCYDNITQYDWDNVVVITGDVGRGKSNLGLWMADEWFNLQEKDLNKVDIKNHVAMTAQDFAEGIAAVKQYDIIMHDEAGDISSRTAMNKVNVMFMKAYQVIRGANLFTILCIPSIWYLDSYFRGTRVRQMFYVNKRVKDQYAEYRYWNKKAYRAMLERFRMRNYQPDTYDNSYIMRGRFQKYDGVLAEKYKLMKTEKISIVRKELPTLIKGITSTNKATNERANRIGRLARQGFSTEEIAKLEGCSARTVTRYKSSDTDININNKEVTT